MVSLGLGGGVAHEILETAQIPLSLFYLTLVFDMGLGLRLVKNWVKRKAQWLPTPMTIFIQDLYPLLL